MAFDKVPNLDLIVFDLDYTLWPFYVDTHVTPPFSKNHNGEIVDIHGTKIKHYPDTPDILKGLHEAGYKLGIASRTHAPTEARKLVQLFGWEKYFTVSEIYPGCKIEHFTKMQTKLDIAFNRMLFFDDEQRNIRDLTSIGVTSILVKNGVNKKLVADAVSNFGK